MSDVLPGYCAPSTSADGTLFFCQSSQLDLATFPRARWAYGRFVVDCVNGNISLRDAVTRILGALGRRVRRETSRSRPDVGLALAGSGFATPTASLCLAPGEFVEVRSRKEIQATLDVQSRNRGLSFEESMLPMCGRRFRVARRVNQIVLETSGKMQTLRDTVALEGVCCPDCARANVLYWREIWLKRVADE